MMPSTPSSAPMGVASITGPSWSTSSSCAVPNASGAAKPNASAHVSTSAPEPKNANTTAPADASHGRTPGVRTTAKSNHVATTCTTSTGTRYGR